VTSVAVGPDRDEVEDALGPETLRTDGSGDQRSKATLVEGVVYRDAGAWSATVLDLLRHYERVGFTGAPRVVGSGMSADGRETVTYLEGTSPHPKAWDDEALFAVGRLLHDAHAAGADFTVPQVAKWQPWFGRDLVGRHPVIGHCDVGPWNVVANANGPYALIDWEYAGPTDALWELAQAVWLNAQLHDDDIAELHALPPAGERAKQAGLLLDGYGLARDDRAGFVDKLVELAVRSARAEAINHNVTEQSTEALPPTGYPVLWAITWRSRSAAWMIDNRTLLNRAIT
jgi:hypothetical protein